MHVGVMRLELHIPHARSLKEKRSVILRFRDRVRARHAVSIAEVAAQDAHQRAVFGVAVVSGDASVVHEVLERVAHEAATQPDAVLAHRSTEVLAMGDEPLWGDEEGHG